MVLLATSPAYFRGFTLIALREGREGTRDEDYAGQFQVRTRRVLDRETETLIFLLSAKVFFFFLTVDLICMP